MGEDGGMAALPVFLVHFEAPDWCRSAVGTVLGSDVPVAVTVVNNGGELDLDPAVTVVDADRNGGYAGGANIALRRWLEGEAPYCVIASHDLHVEPDTLRLLVAAADRAPTFGILGPATTNWAGQPFDGDENGVEARTGMSGTCLLLRRECITDIGLFDPTFRSYGEDDEICVRAWAHGWKVGRVPEARAEGRGTSDSAYRELNSLANRPLLAMRQHGLKAGLRKFARQVVDLLTGKPLRVSRAVYVRGLVIGLGRLLKGLVRQPPRAH